MSLKQICDLAYVINVEKIERMAENDRVITAVLALGSEEPLEMPTVDQYRAMFDKALNEPPQREAEADSDQAILMKALGLGTHGREDAS